MHTVFCSGLVALVMALCLFSPATRCAAQMPADTAPAEPSPVSTDTASSVAEPAPPAQVPEPAATLTRQTYLELQRLQLREEELWRVREKRSVAGPAVIVGVGIPTFLIMIPMGSILMASSHDYYDDLGSEEDRINKRTMRTGAILLSLGLASLVGIVYGAVRIRQTRRQRSLADRELHAISSARTTVLNVLGPPIVLRRPD